MISRPSMPPPEAKKPGVVIAIGTGPKKPGEGGDPSADSGDGKSPDKLERAGVIRADKHCQTCENWSPETGDCKELPGSFDADDACLVFYEGMNDAGDDDEAAEGEGQMPPPEPAPAGAPTA